MPNEPLKSPPENTEITGGLPNPYGRFTYAGTEKGLLDSNIPKDKLSQVTDTISAGLNWFVPNEAKKQIKILQHLFEDDSFFIKSSTNGKATDISTFYQIYDPSVSFPDTLDDSALQFIPFITIVDVSDDTIITKGEDKKTYIYNFNEPVKLSPHTIPPSIINKTSTEQKAEIIAFEGIKTKYTYIFYGVNFIDINKDKLPSSYNNYWARDSKGVNYTPSIDTFNDLVSNTNEFIYDTKKDASGNYPTKGDKTGYAILKVANGMSSFGITILTKSFEIIDPLLMRSEIGKDPVAPSATGNSTSSGSSTGTTGSSTAQSGVGGVCYNCDTSAKQWMTRRLEFGESSTFGIGGSTPKSKETLDKEKPKWWIDASVQGLVSSLLSINATLVKDWNTFICKKVLSPVGTGQAGAAGDAPSVPEKYSSLQNANSSPYNAEAVANAYQKVVATQNAFNGPKSQLEGKGITIKIVEEQSNPVNLYSDILSKCYP